MARRGLLLLALTALALHKAFLPVTPEAPQDKVSRSTLRLLPLVAPLAASPAWADKGVTTAWKVRPDGGEDDVHLGGVEWEDIKLGKGSAPQIGDQIGVRYVLKAYVREREVVVEDLTNGKARDFRFGVGQLLPGMDEGIEYRPTNTFLIVVQLVSLHSPSFHKTFVTIRDIML